MIASTSGRLPLTHSAVTRPCLTAQISRRAANRNSIGLLGRRSTRRISRIGAVVPPEKEEERGGTGLIEKPLFDRSDDSSQVLPDNFYGSTEQPPGKGLGGGDWRVMLLDSPTHTEQLVVKVVTSVVSSVDEQQAKNCFSTSKQLGQALIVSCLKEHAEFFTQMINRGGVRSIIEPDTTTL